MFISAFVWFLITITKVLSLEGRLGTRLCLQPILTFSCFASPQDPNSYVFGKLRGNLYAEISILCIYQVLFYLWQIKPVLTQYYDQDGSYSFKWILYVFWASF